jgi:hypothetical protein
MTTTKLLTKEILKKLPPLYAGENLQADQVRVIAKFFYPASGATWYATEFDPKENLFFGFVNLGDDTMAELGCFTLQELEEFRHPEYSCLRIERDRFWNDKTTLADVMSFKVR